ncbi:MAG: PKD domain-containing protein [Patescibacteria group bacterium]
MKRIILALVFSLFLAAPVAAQEASTLPPPPSLDQQIASVRAQIAQLTAQLNQLLAQKRGNFCYNFRYNLRYNDGHPDWLKLNEILGYENVSTVQELQEKYANEILRPAGLARGTGFVGPATRAKLNALYRCRPLPGNQSPVINSVTGPTTLRVGEMGTWNIVAHDPEQGPLTYSILWGDGPASPSPANIPFLPNAALENRQVSTLSHTYISLGIFTVRISVSDNAGNTTPSTLTVTVIDANQPRITVLSPNGGEAWLTNTVQPLTWRAENVPSDSKINLSLITHRPCYGPICPMINSGPPILLDKDIPVQSNYNWIVATDIANNYIQPGNYYLSVCLAGSTVSVCDHNDQAFSIVGPANAIAN